MQLYIINAYYCRLYFLGYASEYQDVDNLTKVPWSWTHMLILNCLDGVRAFPMGFYNFRSPRTNYNNQSHKILL